MQSVYYRDQILVIFSNKFSLVLSRFSLVWFCDPMDCRLPASSVHGIFQARTLEWVAISFSKCSSVIYKLKIFLFFSNNWSFCILASLLSFCSILSRIFSFIWKLKKPSWLWKWISFYAALEILLHFCSHWAICVLPLVFKYHVSYTFSL